MEKFTIPPFWLPTAAAIASRTWMKPSKVRLSYFSHIFFFNACWLTSSQIAKPLPAANERVRKSPPCTTSEDAAVTIKRPKTDTAGSRGRTRISDFDALTKSLADEAKSIYQAQIIAVQAWPSTTENQDYITQAWIEVCDSRSVRIKLDDEILKVVSTWLLFLFIFF